MKKILVSVVAFVVAYSVANAEPIRVACIGDSITFGAGVMEATNRYPARLGLLLGQDYDVRNFGSNGTTMLDQGDFPYKHSDQFLKAIAFVPDVVVIKLGTNDSKSSNFKKISEFHTSAVSLVERFKALNPKVRILFAYPVPVVGEGNFGINNEAVKEKIIPLIQQVADEKKLQIVDLYRVFSGREALLPDRVHPNDEGARLIARAVYEAIIEKR
jgi:acyl-CoA thioesterase I